MSIEEFHDSLSREQPPLELSPVLASLWFDAKGNWKKSHEIIAELESKDAALIHAYLHRKEGDLSNAEYWYRRAKTHMPDTDFETEREILVNKFISNADIQLMK